MICDISPTILHQLGRCIWCVKRDSVFRWNFNLLIRHKLEFPGSEILIIFFEISNTLTVYERQVTNSS